MVTDGMLQNLNKLPAVKLRDESALSPRAQTVLAYMVYGLDKPHGDLPTGRPLGVQQVAELMGVRRSYVRGLLANPVFKVEYNQAIALARQAATPRAFHRIVELVESENEGIALRAAQAIVGDEKGFSVNVNVATQTNIAAAIRPGYAIRLPADLAAREEPARGTRNPAEPVPEPEPGRMGEGGTPERNGTPVPFMMSGEPPGW